MKNLKKRLLTLFLNIVIVAYFTIYRISLVYKLIILCLEATSHVKQIAD